MVAPVLGHLTSLLSATFSADQPAVFRRGLPDLYGSMFWIVATAVLVVAACELAGLRYIANNKVGVVEKLWSVKGSVTEGRIIALGGEAGFQAELLRGGLHFGYWRWQFRIHRMPLVSVSQGKIGYVYARDGEALLPSQTLPAQVIPCNNFFRMPGAFSGRASETTGPEREPVWPARAGSGRSCARVSLRDQRRAVHGDDRGYGLPTGSQAAQRS